MTLRSDEDQGRLANDIIEGKRPFGDAKHLHGYHLAKVMVFRRDFPLDRMAKDARFREIQHINLAWVLAERADAPLDRLDELNGLLLVMVLTARPDIPLDHPKVNLTSWERALLERHRRS